MRVGDFLRENPKLRPASPGKFEGGHHIDRYIYELSLDGGETVGDVSEMGEAITAVEFNFSDVEREACEAGDVLTPEEADFVVVHQYATVAEDEQGFVTVDYYTGYLALKKAMDYARSQEEKFYAEQESSEDEE